VLTRMTFAAGALGASLAFAGTALAAPSPFVPHGRRHAAVHRQFSRSASSPAAAKAAMLYVNGDTGSDQNGANTCRLAKNPCKTITQAISIAPATATIKVAGGDYPEQLTITGKDLTITGAGATKTIIDPTSLQTVTNDPDNPTSPEAVVVDFENTSGGGLSNLTVDGSGADEPSDNSCDLDYVGVQFIDSTGLLSSDTVTGIQEQPAYSGCQGGLGVYVANSTGDPQTVTMKGLIVDKYQKNGITCDDVGTTCTISGSTVDGIGPTGSNAQNGIQLYDASAGSVTSTAVADNSYTSPDFTLENDEYYGASGILVWDVGALTLTSNHTNNNDGDIFGYEDGTGPAQGTWTISKNSVIDGTNDTGEDGGTAVPLGYGIGDGIDLEGTGATTDVYGNTVSDNADWGIALFGATDANIGGTAKGEPNTVSDNADDGIYLGEFSAGEPSTGDTVAKNTVKGNQDDGILADGTDSSGDATEYGNAFMNNVLQANVRYDAEDLSSGGTGPSGVNNTWMGNTCKPTKDSNPLGLCS
jgi:parallel beta-helix repeat protein